MDLQGYWKGAFGEGGGKKGSGGMDIAHVDVQDVVCCWSLNICTVRRWGHNFQSLRGSRSPAGLSQNPSLSSRTQKQTKAASEGRETEFEV